MQQSKFGLPVTATGSTRKSVMPEESEVGILRRIERSMVRTICGVQLKHRKRSMDLIFMLGLNETMDQLAMVNCVHWCGHVLWREDCHVLRRPLDFEVECQRKKGCLKRT